MSDAAAGLQLELEGLEAEQAFAALLDHAVSWNISDLFFASHEGHLMVQARHLGILRSITHLPDELGRRCLSYIKVKADLDLSERRRPGLPPPACTPATTPPWSRACA